MGLSTNSRTSGASSLSGCQGREPHLGPDGCCGLLFKVGQRFAAPFGGDLQLGQGDVAFPPFVPADDPCRATQELAHLLLSQSSCAAALAELHGQDLAAKEHRLPERRCIVHRLTRGGKRSCRPTGWPVVH